ncbi:MAG: hypothetical protein SFY66_01750 [Oculatellaceae cyanobacterium bins.114]|nr:hypothetical protein [Oculatellaceae cyanobacterium bins.114]
MDVPKTTDLETMKGCYNQNLASAESADFLLSSRPALMGLEGNTKRGNRRTLATLLVQLEETEEQIEILQRFQSDLIKEITRIRQQLPKGF